MDNTTRVVSAIDEKDPSASDQLFALVYSELRSLAARKMAGEAADHTLQATALVHEAYLRLVDTASLQKWNGRGHFFAAAAEAMRRILIENARRKIGVNRGIRRRRLPLEALPANREGQLPFDMLEFNDAVTALESAAPDIAALVKLRVFAGLSHQEAAEMLGISERTAKRYWRFARAWLFERLAAPD